MTLKISIIFAFADTRGRVSEIGKGKVINVDSTLWTPHCGDSKLELAKTKLQLRNQRI